MQCFNQRNGCLRARHCYEEKLNTAWQAASQDIYAAQQQASAQANAEGGPTAEPQAETVSDVEFEEVKDEKQ